MASIINVDKIRAASGTTNVIDINSSCNTTALTIDSSGRLLTPVKPYVSAGWDGSSVSSGKYTAYLTTDTTMASGSSRIIYKNDYSMLNTSTGVVTIPVAGTYLICGHYADGTGSATRRIGHLWVTPSGGSEVFYGEWIESYGLYDDSTIGKLFQFGAGDTVMFGHNTGFPYDDFGFEMVFLG